MIEITDDVDWNHLVVANKADPIVDRVEKDPDDVPQSGGKANVEIIQNDHGLYFLKSCYIINNELLSFT